MHAPLRALVAATLSLLAFACVAEPTQTCSEPLSASAAKLEVARCEGSATSCSSFTAIGCSQDGCSVDIGRYDDPYDDRCTGYPKRCTDYMHPSSCRLQQGCRWVEPDGGAAAKDGSSAGPSASAPASSPCATGDGGAQASDGATPGNPDDAATSPTPSRDAGPAPDAGGGGPVAPPPAPSPAPAPAPDAGTGGGPGAPPAPPSR